MVVENELMNSNAGIVLIVEIVLLEITAWP
jgi:hypothetical protein